MIPLAEDSILCFIGDCYLGSEPLSFSLAPEISRILKQADLVVADLEGPITDREIPAFDKCCIKSASPTAAKLREWGVNLVTVANNHIFDYGWDGFKDTVRHLEENDLLYAGAGKNLQEATAPLVLEVNGNRLGFLAFSWEVIQTKCATKDSFGCAPLDEGLTIAAIQDLSPRVDALIPLLHWGYCGYTAPLPAHRVLAKGLLQAGAAAIVGCHAHVTQGIDIFDQKVAAYSLGNFVFSPYVDRHRAYMASEEHRKGMVLELRLKTDGSVSHKCYFTINVEGTVFLDDSPSRLKESAERDAILTYPDYDSFWRQYNRQRFIDRIMHWCRPGNWRHINKDTLAGAVIMFKDMCSRRSSLRLS